VFYFTSFHNAGKLSVNLGSKRH